MNLCAYATIEEIKRYFNVAQGYELTTDDGILKEFCLKASRKLEILTNRMFYPVLQTRYYNHPTNLSVLELQTDLLELITLTTQNGTQVIPATSFYLQSATDYNTKPFDRIVMRSDVGQLFNFSGSPQKANSVYGLFGYNEDWDDAWELLDTVQDSPLLVSGTIITVTGIEDEDAFGVSPKFRTQQLLRLGTGPEAEMVYVKSKNTDELTLTVTRAVNGTTAVEHLAGTPIYVYRPMTEISEAIQILATYMYRRKDSVGTTEDREVASSSGMLLLPSKLPSEVQDIVDKYKCWNYHSKANL